MQVRGKRDPSNRDGQTVGGSTGGCGDRPGRGETTTQGSWTTGTCWRRVLCAVSATGGRLELCTDRSSTLCLQFSHHSISFYQPHSEGGIVSVVCMSVVNAITLWTVWDYHHEFFIGARYDQNLAHYYYFFFIKNECHINIIVDRLQGCSHSKKLRESESESRSSKVVWQAQCQYCCKNARTVEFSKMFENDCIPMHCGDLT